MMTEMATHSNRYVTVVYISSKFAKKTNNTVFIQKNHFLFFGQLVLNLCPFRVCLQTVQLRDFPFSCIFFLCPFACVFF